MLESLDILIAFTVIMAVSSLLITVLVQVAGMLLNLRGRNLLNGVKAAFNAIDPQVLEKAPHLVEYLLTRPTLSDHTTVKGHALNDEKNRAKFLPGVPAPNCLQHWSVVSSLTAAVKPDELFQAIHRLAHPTTNQETAAKEAVAKSLPARAPQSDKDALIAKSKVLQEQAAKLLEALGFNHTQFTQWKAFEEKKKQTFAVLEALNSALEGLPAGAAKTALETQRDAVVTELANAINAVTSGVAKVAGGIDAAYARFQYWFETSQIRAIQWFTMHTRWFTITFAVLLTGLFQLDTVEIFRRISSEEKLRQNLVGAARLIEKQGEVILSKTPDVIGTAWNAWLTEEKIVTDAKKAGAPHAAATPQPIPASPQPAKGSLKSAKNVLGAEKVQALQEAWKALPELERTEARVDRMIRETVGIESDPEQLRVLARFHQLVGEKVQDQLSNYRQTSEDLTAALGKAGFDLIPTGLKRWDGDYPLVWFKHFFGMLATIALLSLGAPFWFNLLRTMTNLRSKLAGEIDEEQKANGAVPSPAARKPASPAANTLPALQT